MHCTVLTHLANTLTCGCMSILCTGGSGAGKTSLLNALCGRAHYGVVSGEVVINGQKAKIEDNIGAMGFVPQDDIVYAELTVRENLIFAGLFRLPKGTPMYKIEEYAEEAIADLGLSRVADSMVGDVHRRGVSGGEKKRVNIGLELMAKPSILFLDEPTRYVPDVLIFDFVPTLDCFDADLCQLYVYSGFFCKLSV